LDFGFRGKNELFFDEVDLKNGRIVGLRNYFLKQKSSEKSCFSPEAKVQRYSYPSIAIWATKDSMQSKDILVRGGQGGLLR
jgi:hypothetical protein